MFEGNVVDEPQRRCDLLVYGLRSGDLTFSYSPSVELVQDVSLIFGFPFRESLLATDSSTHHGTSALSMRGAVTQHKAEVVLYCWRTHTD